MSSKHYLITEDASHFIESRRLLFQSDILEQCKCALWVLWEQEYDFCESEDDIPVSEAELHEKATAFANMNIRERVEKRQYICDGLYGAEGEDEPCSVCGYHAKTDLKFDVDDAFNSRETELAVISSDLESKIVNVMEAVHSTAGNFDYREIAYIASVLMDLTSEDLSALHSLDRGVIPCSYDELYPDEDDCEVA